MSNTRDVTLIGRWHPLPFEPHLCQTSTRYARPYGLEPLVTWSCTTHQPLWGLWSPQKPCRCAIVHPTAHTSNRPGVLGCVAARNRPRPREMRCGEIALHMRSINEIPFLGPQWTKQEAITCLIPMQCLQLR
jgi:hypothetical protein